MSATPRTDKGEKTLQQWWDECDEESSTPMVKSLVARTLERELETTRRELAAAIDDRDWWKNAAGHERYEAWKAIAAMTKERDEWKRLHDDTLTRLLSGRL